MTNNPSKDQIINQAIKFHLQGNIAEAKKYYESCINNGYKDCRVFANYGAILHSLGNLKDAELFYRQSIELNPNFGNPHSNLGLILREKGELKEAELFSRKAIELNPNSANFHGNLGNILINLGKLQDAEISYRKVIEMNPNNANAYYHIAYILNKKGNVTEAFNYFLKTIEVNPNYPNILQTICIFLNEANPALLNQPKLKNLLILLLNQENIPHRLLFRPFNFLYRNEIINLLKDKNINFSKIKISNHKKIINNALKKIIFCDIHLEESLTKIRKKACQEIANTQDIINNESLEFLIALGQQCFNNEYIYYIKQEEKVSIKKIIRKCIEEEINEKNIAILSCYFPLYKLLKQIPSLKSFKSSNKSFQKLIELQIKEPLKEIELSKQIKQLGQVNNCISQKVQSHYEENPYPRWSNIEKLSEEVKKSCSEVINSEIQPNSIIHKINHKQLNVLIAGCGTGQHILIRQKYKNAKFKAIDLSLPSLSYAKRKINELNIKNIELIQMDLLEVHLLKEKFDIIESIGVLVCIENPVLGLKKLLSVLHEDGFLKLGLYSELGRQDIIQSRKYIGSTKNKNLEDDIRNFRQKIISGELNHLNSLRSRGDFYSLSQCRDLCFHSIENRFTINQIKEIIVTNKLNFLGFCLPQLTKSLYAKYFPEDNQQIDLDNWRQFEEKHPETFKNMYHFWVSKKN